MSRLSLLMVGVLVLLSPLSPVRAANVGISPASVQFSEVLRNGYAERTIVVSVDTEDPVFVTVVPRGDIAGWFDNVSLENFSVSRGEPYLLNVAVRPPSDIPNGEYRGFLRLMASELGDGIEDHAVSVVRPSLDLSLLVEVTDVEVVQCSAGEYSVRPVEQGEEATFSLKVDNQGNVRLRPTVTITLWDQEKTSVVLEESFLGDEILPTVTGDLSLDLSSRGLSLGQYWAEVSVLECYDQSTLSFDVLEEGALWAHGKLLGISAKGIAEKDETIPITARFENIGEKDVRAQFRGSISRGDRVIQVLEHPMTDVSVAEVYSFPFYFTPQQSGTYVIRGRVYYSGKQTFEATKVIEVVGSGFSFGNAFVLLLYVLVLFAIAILFIKVRRERQRLLRKTRALRGGRL